MVQIKNKILEKEPVFKKIGINFLLLSVASLLFALSFPNFISETGFGFLGFFALVPVFIVIFRAGWAGTFFYGAFFGFLSYFLYNYWLIKFHPLAIFIVPVIYLFYFLLLFPVLKVCNCFFPKYPYVFQVLIWILFEYIRSSGFLGYSYGVIGYTQYGFLPLIQISELTGIWGVVGLVVFPSVYLGFCLREGIPSFINRLKSNVLPGLLYMGVFVLVLVYGFATTVNMDETKSWKASLVQQNIDPWVGGYSAYEKSLNVLIELSEQAVLDNPDIIVWSETSFVPAIDYHNRYQEHPVAYRLVRRFLDFIKNQKIPYVVGNDDGQKVGIGTPEERRVDFNASILFDKGKRVRTYRKVHLVPFTEHFPYKKELPWIYDLLKNVDTHFWEKGTEYTVFESGGVKFSTPICFEDTFGYLCAEFVRRGADVLVNMTNDTWSFSVVAEMQHMTIAVFRAVENRRSLLRSSNSGITCAIDPEGRILDTLKPFIPGYLTTSVPVYNETVTLYTLWGDWFPFFVLILLIVLIFVTIIKKAIAKKMN